MNARDIVVVGTSAGGLNALKKLVADLPREFSAAVFIVRHISASTPSILPQILQSTGTLKVKHPSDGEVFFPGHIYCAPPDHHMMIEGDCVRLTRGPKENRVRPAVDALFRSAALALKRRVVGVILSGALDDGTAGLWSVKFQGGVTIVQDPHEAEYPGMPQSALNHVQVDYCIPLREIAPLLVTLSADPIDDDPGHLLSKSLELENRIALGEFRVLKEIDKLGPLAGFTCPDCHSSMRTA